MACWDQQRAEDAARDFRQEAGPNQDEVVIKHLDLASMKSVHSFCEEILKAESWIDILINSAGVFQCPYTKTDEGFEMQFGVNPSRIIVVSAKLYKYRDINFEDLNSEQSYNKAFAYSQSKLANLLFTLELAQHLGETPLYLACSPKVEGIKGRCFANCEEEELLPKATDEQGARKLWEISEVMVGLTK
ncbi:hypothetical protein SKAU_G00189940 [Synaphobranchus kaupii]|uniref:Retinol dehydrogenase 14 n=1 Tax=Synaphobranchus kaupii TaxID=118154 RepID=A0A9Q1IXB1_SYNKA|nr:hypothetical protein SKAU_G00189940 [Synaphobranchus kaupii]